MPPGTFISLFEKNGFVLKLDMYVFEETCKVLANQIACGISPVPISTNFSRIHMYNRNFAKNLAEIAGKYNIPPHLLEIEITENAFTSNPIYLISLIESLHGYGFLVSVDDFGSGYSSLNVLAQIPADVIKLDKKFFDFDTGKARQKQFIKYLIRMMKHMGVMTVMEGVETEEQVSFMKKCGCDVVQGYYYAKPMPLSEFRKFIRDFNDNVSEPVSS